MSKEIKWLPSVVLSLIVLPPYEELYGALFFREIMAFYEIYLILRFRAVLIIVTAAVVRILGILLSSLGSLFLVLICLLFPSMCALTLD